MVKLIAVNIWDDYHDDGIGKIQNTVAYLTSDVHGFSNNECEILIKAAYKVLKNHFSCRLIKEKFEDEIFEILITNISHKERKVFMKADKGNKYPTELGFELEFISES